MNDTVAVKDRKLQDKENEVEKLKLTLRNELLFLHPKTQSGTNTSPEYSFLKNINLLLILTFNKKKILCSRGYKEK